MLGFVSMFLQKSIEAQESILKPRAMPAPRVILRELQREKYAPDSAAACHGQLVGQSGSCASQPSSQSVPCLFRLFCYL